MTCFSSTDIALDPSVDESLVWSLRAFQDRARALDFVRHFSRSLSVYSRKVGQLYATYQVALTDAVAEEMVVMPNLEAFTETWYAIPERAILQTGYTIIPGALVGERGPCLYMPVAYSDRGRAMPLAQGLRRVAQEFAQRGEDFLPVLTKGDLKAFRKRAPVLHLHRIDLAAMYEKSRFERNDLSRGIKEKLRNCMA